ncbi:hypothetical protein [Pontiella agarivorans]|uniref:Uncharacterized protein n=1 Tax=Pontiella agarivorans TaxID=3038953 RepID=A0ABU5N118_9BACT|nr:hypothetical protein [Pontiella agarivorans]MDZ8119936.1 hypothetical protein [Pontiella agarivorans]
MSSADKIMVSKENGRLQLPYKDYVAIMEKVKEGRRMREVKNTVMADLRQVLGGAVAAVEVQKKVAAARKDVSAQEPQSDKAAEAVSVEADSGTPAVRPGGRAASERGGIPEGMAVPPIKKDISVHFNKLDESGRLFSVFKQYYAFLNDACGGTVRVTLKDGICSLWNYDEWEEFAFIDIYERQLRISLDQRYTDALQSLNLCEVPRLLSSRLNLVCVQVNDLNDTMLKVMAKAFEEVGLTAS